MKDEGVLGMDGLGNEEWRNVRNGWCLPFYWSGREQHQGCWVRERRGRLMEEALELGTHLDWK